jgi:hypothetical protein
VSALNPRLKKLPSRFQSVFDIIQGYPP